jgi:hypothetical protein
MDLEAIAPIIEEIIKDTLEEKRYAFGYAKYRGIGNKVASGNLKNSVQVNVQPKNNNIVVLKVIMADYAEYVQQGRRPGKKNVPIKSLLDWIKERNLKGRNKKGRFISNLSFAFAIQKNINKFGIRPSNFIDFSIDKLLSDTRISTLIEDAAYEDLINAIEGI